MGPNSNTTPNSGDNKEAKEKNAEETAADSGKRDNGAEKERDTGYSENYPWNEVKSEKISENKPHETLIKKRGFLIAVENNGEAKKILSEEIIRMDKQYENISGSYIASQQINIKRLEELQKNNAITQEELWTKKTLIEKKITEDIPEQKTLLEKEITQIEETILLKLKEIGRDKENIVRQSIAALKENISEGLKINRDLQDEQNKELGNEFEKDKAATAKKITFWEEILDTHKEQYSNINTRLKLLSKDGINNHTSAFLIFLGSIAALVSGWWFSLWTGPNPGKNDLNNVSDNTSVKFFFLDNLGRFLSQYGLLELIAGIAVYIILVGVVSWLCFYISKTAGFIPKDKKSKKKAEENDDDFEIDLNEDDKFIKAKFKGNNWWAIWLKMAPVIIALLPLLTIISYPADANNEHSKFQSLFDSMVNQFIGTCIAISFTTFTLLFFSRITENKYHSKEISEAAKSGAPFYLGFIIFLLMIVSMFLYHTMIFDDVRKVAIVGFLVSCIATGFSLGYGYLFRSLYDNAEFLLLRIEAISTIIDRYSKQFRVNYTTNKWLRARIYNLQQKIFDTIEERHDMATVIAGGYPADLRQQKRTNMIPEKIRPAEKNSVPDNNSKNFFRAIWHFLTTGSKSENSKKEAEEKKHKLTHQVSDNELKYFSEKAEELNYSNQKLQELKNKLEALVTEENEYYRNEGVVQFINTKIQNLQIDKIQIGLQIASLESSMLIERKKIEDHCEAEKTLLKEGFYTGEWFKDTLVKNKIYPDEK